MATYILVHGSWTGGWVWKLVAERPDKFQKTVTAAEKKLLEELLERSGLYAALVARDVTEEPVEG